MDITLLSNVQMRKFNYTILVRVSRMWEFYGKNDDEPPKHLDLVLVDQQGTPMYAEIHHEIIPIFKPKLQEGKIYYMRKIIIEKAKQLFKPVRGLFMIRINRMTEIAELNGDQPGFPMYTFSLTPIPELHKFQGNNEYFLDVIGRIVALSDPTKVITNTGAVRTKTLIHLMDLSGNKVDISLWGGRAEEFPTEHVYDTGKESHVIAIFVGTTVKSYGAAAPFLSGTSACRWYINKAEIPEITAFYSRVSQKIENIQKLEILNVDDARNKIEEKTLLQLKAVEPFVHMDKKFECTITFTRFVNLRTWCYPACRRCNSSAKIENNVYICNKEETTCSSIVHRYILPVIATDGTWELEFMVFDERASILIGKTAHKLIKEYSRFEIPPEINNLIGEKITAIVRVMTDKSVQPSKKEPCFEILRIKKRYGKDYLTTGFSKGQSSPILERTPSLPSNLPPLLPIGTKKETTQLSYSEELPEDSQVMEIDQTSLTFPPSGQQKRALHISDDPTKELPDEAEYDSTLIQKGKKKRD